MEREMYSLEILDLEASLREALNDDGDFYLDDEEFIEEEIRWHTDNLIRKQNGLRAE